MLNSNIVKKFLLQGIFRVRTHQQSRVEFNPVQSDSQRRGSELWLTYNYRSSQYTVAAVAVRNTNRVESS
jgi:hypothetical protein